MVTLKRGLLTGYHQDFINLLSPPRLTPGPSYQHTPIGDLFIPFLVYDLIDVQFCFLEGADKGLTCGLF